MSIESSNALEITDGKFQRHLIAHFLSLLKFGTVGFISGVIYFAFMWVILNVISKNYVVAFSISYIASVLFHYFANRHFTFGAKTKNMYSQMKKYLTMLAVNYFVSLAIVSIAVNKLHLSPYLGALLAILCTTLPGYIASKYWIFKKDIL